MYRSKLLLLSLIVAALAAGSSTSAHAQEHGRAGLVIVPIEGAVLTRCVELDQPAVSGERLLALSGLDVVSDPQFSMGITVCRIEGVGCDHPAEDCFCKCRGSPCTYWSYWRLDEAEGWVYSGMGAAGTSVTAGAVDAWVWGDGSAGMASELPALTIDDICAPEVETAEPVAVAQTSTETFAKPPEASIAAPAPEVANPSELPGWQRAAGIAVVIAIPIMVLVLQRWSRRQ